MAILTACQATFTDITSVEVGGRNLVKNSSVEKSISNGVIIYDLTSYGEDIIVGKKIVFSFGAYSSIAGVTIDAYIEGSSVVEGDAAVSLVECNVSPAPIENIQTTYQRYSVAIEIQEKCSPMYACIRSNSDSGAGYNTNATIYVKNIKVELGDVPTDWTAAPEDLESEVDKISKNKNKVWYQTTAPSGTDHQVNDVWFDTDDSNAMYMWDGSSWVLKEFGKTAIADDSITTEKIVAGAVTTSEIAAGAITTDRLSANSVTSEKIATRSVTADKVDVADLFAQDITATGTISGLKLRGEAINIIATSPTPADEDPNGYYTVSLTTKDYDAGSSTIVKSLEIQTTNKGGSNLLRMAGGTMEIESDSLEITGDTTFYISVPKYSESRGDAVYWMYPCQTGTSNGWSYEKYYDGRLHCTIRIPVEGVAGTTAMGSLYRSEQAFSPSSYPYPFTFTQHPTTEYSYVPSNSTGAMMWIYHSGTTTTPPPCYLIRTVSTEAYWGYVNITAHGYWK